MNIKRILGALLTVLGIGCLIFIATLFVNSNGGSYVKALVMYGILALIFVTSEISRASHQR